MLFYCVFQAFARAEFWHGCCGHMHFFTCAWIACFARGSLFGKKSAKTSDAYLITLFERVGDGIKNGIYRVLGGIFGPSDLVKYGICEITLIHNIVVKTCNADNRRLDQP